MAQVIRLDLAGNTKHVTPLFALVSHCTVLQLNKPSGQRPPVTTVFIWNGIVLFFHLFCLHVTAHDSQSIYML